MIKKPKILNITALQKTVGQYYRECNASTPPKVYLAMVIANRVAQAQRNDTYNQMLAQFRALLSFTVKIDDNKVIVDKYDWDRVWQALGEE